MIYAFGGEVNIVETRAEADRLGGINDNLHPEQMSEAWTEP